MVTMYDVQQLDFEYIEDYFDYILDSRTNGQHKQAKELFLKLSDKQKKQFFEYVSSLTQTEDFETFEQEFEDYINKTNL